MRNWVDEAKERWPRPVWIKLHDDDGYHNWLYQQYASWLKQRQMEMELWRSRQIEAENRDIKLEGDA